MSKIKGARTWKSNFTFKTKTAKKDGPFCQLSLCEEVAHVHLTVVERRHCVNWSLIIPWRAASTAPGRITDGTKEFLGCKGMSLYCFSLELLINRLPGKKDGFDTVKNAPRPKEAPEQHKNQTSLILKYFVGKVFALDRLHGGTLVLWEELQTWTINHGCNEAKFERRSHGRAMNWIRVIRDQSQLSLICR